MQTLERNPKSEPDVCETLWVTCLHAHQPSYYSNFCVTLYFVKYINSIPFYEEQSCQASKSLIDSLQSIHSHCSRTHIFFGTTLEVIITHFIEN